MYAEIMTLVERGLGDGPTDGIIYSQKNVDNIRIVATALATLSMVADLLTIYWFSRMTRKWRHVLIMTLIIADLLKDINYIALAAVAFVQNNVATESRFCQASGFFHQYLVEVTDFVILTIVVHMSVQVLKPKAAVNGSEGGLEKWKAWIYLGILGLPLVMACVAFANPNSGYQLVGAFCALPVRPFWFRLTLSWIPRYIIAVTLVVLTIIIRYKIRKYQEKLAQLQGSMASRGQIEDGTIEELEESDEEHENQSNKPKGDEISDGSDGSTDANEKCLTVDEKSTPVHNKRRTLMFASDPPSMPATATEYQQPTTTEDLRKNKRMSYKRRTMYSTYNEYGAARGGSIAPSIAASSAVFGPQAAAGGYRNSMLAESFVLEPSTRARRRQSIADFHTIGHRRSQSVVEMPSLRRRSSVAEMPRSESMSQAHLSEHFGERMLSLPYTDGSGSVVSQPGRRSSIWDEIDASLDKKMTNRMSMFTVHANDASGAAQPPPLHDLPARPPSPVHYESDKVAISARNSMIAHPNPLGQNRNSRRISRAAFPSGRGSMIYTMARRTVSIISSGRVAVGQQQEEQEKEQEQQGQAEADAAAAAVATAPANQAAVIMQRRHRYIQRQLRYLTLYPIVYLLLWFCPFLLHVLQYHDRFATQPPFALAVLNIVSMTLFGFVNSLVFCLREKPWTMIEGTDGTVLGSLAADPLWLSAQRVWWRKTGKAEGGLDFAG